MDAMIDGIFGDGTLRGGAEAGGPGDACGLDGARALGDGGDLGPGGIGAALDAADRTGDWGTASGWGTGGDEGRGMIVEIGGQYFDVGSGTADVDDDGVADSVTLADDRGLSIYSDVDGDGNVDHVTTILFDGTYETWTADPSQSSPDAAHPGAPGDHRTPAPGGDPTAPPSDIGVKSIGGSGQGEENADDRAADVPSGWGVHEWERGEKGRWA